MEALLFPVAPFLALVLVSAAAHKLIERDRLAGAAANLTGTSPRTGTALSIAAAAVEAMAAAAILVPATRTVGASAAAALWSLYAVLLLAKSARHGTAFDCGCAFRASAGTGRHGLSAVRPLLLALLALTLVFLSSGALALEPVCAAVAFFSLYLAAGELAALPPFRRSFAR